MRLKASYPIVKEVFVKPREAKIWVESQLALGLVVMQEEGTQTFYSGPSYEDIFDHYADTVATQKHKVLLEVTSV